MVLKLTIEKELAMEGSPTWIISIDNFAQNLMQNPKAAATKI